MRLRKNINSTGRLIRLTIALLLLTYAYIEQSWIAFGASIFTFLEALFSWCVIYQILGINSCPTRKK